jgi:hypothetical protein
MRAYRAAPGAAALAPLPFARSLLERAHQALGGLQTRLHGPRAATENAIGQVVASGGAPGAGLAGLTKAVALCAATATGAAACLGAGVVPAPLGLVGDAPASRPAASRDATAAPESRPAATSAPLPDHTPTRSPESADTHRDPEPPPPPAEQETVPTEAGAFEYAPEAPPPAPAPVAAPSAAETGTGGAAGEFGP